MTTEPTKKWTKGPWNIDPSGDGRIYIRGPIGSSRNTNRSTKAVCLIGSSRPYASPEMAAEDQSNAHLIAAAPELYESLEDAFENGLIYWEPNTKRGAIAKAKMLSVIGAALRKARGEAP